MPTALGKKNPFVEFNQWDPYRSPRWRYDRAAYLAKTRGANRTYDYSRDDEWVAATFKFLKQWKSLTRNNQQATNEMRVSRLYPKWPGLYLAHQLFQANTGDPTRYEVEARILARQTNEEIAQRVSVHPDAIEWYEAVFFNVRDRLDNEGYIGRQVIGPAVAHGLRNISLDFSAKYWGYYGGPYILDLILSDYDPATPKPKIGQDLNSFLDNYWNKAVRVRSANTVGAFDINQFNVLQLFELHANLVNQARAAAESAGGAQTPYEEVMSGIMNSVQWSVGRKRQEALENSPLKAYTGKSVELRVDQMLEVAAGGTPNLEHVDTITFPPPRVSEEDNEDSQQGS
jgi:hypothetical protein